MKANPFSYRFNRHARGYPATVEDVVIIRTLPDKLDIRLSERQLLPC